MTNTFKKLNFKNQKEIIVIQNPESFEEELKQMETFTSIQKNLDDSASFEFIIFFVTQQSEIDTFAEKIKNQLQNDPIIWFVYPKSTSKKYTCDFNRDNGWDILGKIGLEPVRQIAIDVDWSALRFRNVNYIKTMTRSFAITEEGKQKSKKRN